MKNLPSSPYATFSAKEWFLATNVSSSFGSVNAPKSKKKYFKGALSKVSKQSKTVQLAFA